MLYPEGGGQPDDAGTVAGLPVRGLRKAEAGLDGRLVRGTCEELPFASSTFDAVISLNTLHNQERAGVIRSLREIVRVGKAQKAFVQVDSYHTPAGRDLFLDWVLTANFHDYPQGWLNVFEESGYRGDWVIWFGGREVADGRMAAPYPSAKMLVEGTNGGAPGGAL